MRTGTGAEGETQETRRLPKSVSSSELSNPQVSRRDGVSRQLDPVGLPAGQSTQNSKLFFCEGGYLKK